MIPTVDLVRRALADGAPWSPRLSRHLADARWRSMASSPCPSREDYGTVRHLSGDAAAPRREFGRIDLPPAFAASAPLPIEALSGATLRRYLALGLEFHDLDASGAIAIVARLREAFDRLAEVPEAAEVVGAVLASLHVLRPDDSDCDVSYSDPHVPFSVFVGVVGTGVRNGALRVAEGMLHECMHLQLTLVEEIVPMVAGDRDLLHSPWRAAERPVQGVLHGLYVFRAIQRFHRALLERGRLGAGERAYLKGRVATIEEEARAIEGLTASRDLTSAGRALSSLLLAVPAPAA